MAPSKLTEQDKQDILDLYRQPEETTANIATRFGVSTTTVSRILKQGLPSDEYETLIQQKRAMISKDITADDLEDDEPEEQPEKPSIAPPKTRRSREAELTTMDLDEDSLSADIDPDLEEDLEEELEELTGQRRQRRRSSATATEEPPQPASTGPGRPIKRSERKSKDEQLMLPNLGELRSGYSTQAEPFEEILQDDITAEEDFDDEIEDDDLDDLDDDFDDDLSLDELDDNQPVMGLQVQGEALLQILPLADAPVPKTFYLVVDRASELITRPLKDFADLGRIPQDEIQERTLPIFDNHRIAKRFQRRMQRIIKVPDGRVLSKVKPYLQAKGITRLLIDGQIYSL